MWELQDASTVTVDASSDDHLNAIAWTPSRMGPGMSATLTDCAIHQLVSRLGFNVDVQEEASVVLHYIWKDDPAKSSTLSGCMSALEDEELYRVLKVAYAHGMYDVIRNWKTSAYSSTSYFTTYSESAQKYHCHCHYAKTQQ